MADWVSIVLPIGTLVIGSGLTMVGQALNDRRSEGRERRGRREAFRISNFDMHRAAMLEMQAIVKDCTEAFISEQRRRVNDGDYQYFEAMINNPTVEHIFSTDDKEKLTLDLEGCSTNEGKAEVFHEHLTAIRTRQERWHEIVTEQTRRLEIWSQFWQEIDQPLKKLRLCMYRSGSNSVMLAGQEFIQANLQWYEHFATTNMELVVERVRASRFELDRALSNALTSGPYDTYGQASS